MTSRGMFGLAALALAGGPALGQATYSQNFDDVAGGWQALAAEGWIIRPVNGGGLYDHSLMWVEDGTYVPPYQGAGCWYMGASIAPPGTVASWAILPPIPNQVAGDTLRFQILHIPSYYGYPGLFEVRYSSSGGTDSGGSNPNAVGDFTTVLAALPSPPANQWTPVTVTVPGNGRIALRAYMNRPSGFQDGVAYCVDSLAFNPTPSGPPFPDPGQTVHWTAAMSPISLAGNNTIAAGGTLIVDAGVVVNMAADCTLNIAGTLHAQGSSAARVTFDGNVNASDESVIVVHGGGRLALDYSNVDSWLQPRAGNVFGSSAGEVVATHSRFSGRGKVEQFYSTQNLSGRRAFLSFADCEFVGVQVQHNGCQAVLRDCTFSDGGQWGLALEGYAKLDNVTLDNTQLFLGGGEIGGGAMYVDNITVRNYATGGGLYLDGARGYLVGPNVVLQGNQYPVEFSEGMPGGLLRGSVIPTAGNINNYIAGTTNPDPGIIGGLWAKLAVPYVVRTGHYVSNLELDPGVVVKFMPGTSWFVEGKLTANGTPEEPITLEPFTPGQAWDNVVFGGLDSLPRFEHCIVRGSARGVGTVEAALNVHNCLFEDNGQAITNGESGFILGVTGSTFRNNGVAFVDIFSSDGSGPFTAGDPISPNIIEGNGLAVDNNDTMHNPRFNLAHNWWGSPTGPTFAGNPGGSGDAIDAGGTAFVTFAPYLAQRPDLSDPPPVVRLITQIGSPEPGDKIFVHWTARDNGAIVRQRVLFSPEFNNPSSFVVLEDNLPPSQRAYEFSVPDIGFNAANVVQALRIEAIDDVGRAGYDETNMYILTGDMSGTFTFTTDFAGPFAPGSPIELTWEHTFPFLEATGLVASFRADGIERSWGGGTLSHGTLGRLNFIPDHSTDFARLIVAVYASLNRVKLFYSQPFSVRPDVRIGDGAPAIAVSSPPAGASYSGGSVVPIAWTAADDEALRDFSIIASYDGGRAYHQVVDELPATATSYGWRLPPSAGIADVRVRVVARDRRFQSASSETAISIAPGDGSAVGDVDGDGDVDLTDLALLLTAFGACAGDGAYNAGADFNASGCIELSDLAVLLTNYGT
jgi:hypothetical protein